MREAILPANGPEYLSLFDNPLDPMISHPIMLMEHDRAATHGWHSAAVDLSWRDEGNQNTWGRDGGLWIQPLPDTPFIHFSVPEGDREALAYVAGLFHMSPNMVRAVPKCQNHESQTFWDLRNSLEERFPTFETVSCLHHRGVENWRAGLSELAPRATVENVSRILHDLGSDACHDRGKMRKQAEEAYPFLALYDERSRDTITAAIDARERLQPILNNVMGIRSGVIDRIRKQPAFTRGQRVAPILFEGLDSELLRDVPEVRELVSAALYAGIPVGLVVTKGYLIPKRQLHAFFVAMDMLQDEGGAISNPADMTDALLKAMRNGAAQPLAEAVKDSAVRQQRRDESNRMHIGKMRQIPGEMPLFDLTEVRELAASYGAEVRQIRTGIEYADLCSEAHRWNEKPGALVIGMRQSGEDNDQFYISVNEAGELNEMPLIRAGKMSSLDKVARFRVLMLLRDKVRDPAWLRDYMDEYALSQTAIAYKAISNRWMADIRNIGWGKSILEILNEKIGSHPASQ